MIRSPASDFFKYPTNTIELLQAWSIPSFTSRDIIYPATEE